MKTVVLYNEKGSFFHLLSVKMRRNINYLHKMNLPITHRDIKPENALLIENNTVK